MKFFGFGLAFLVAQTLSMNAQAIECAKDSRTNGGGSSSIQVIKNHDGFYTVVLSRMSEKTRLSSPRLETVTYVDVRCDVSERNALFVSCEAPINTFGLDTFLKIESEVTYSLKGKFLSVIVDPGNKLSLATPFVPLIQKVSVPLSSCRL